MDTPGVIGVYPGDPSAHSLVAIANSSEQEPMHSLILDLTVFEAWSMERDLVHAILGEGAAMGKKQVGHEPGVFID